MEDFDHFKLIKGQMECDGWKMGGVKLMKDGINKDARDDGVVFILLKTMGTCPIKALRESNICMIFSTGSLMI